MLPFIDEDISQKIDSILERLNQMPNGQRITITDVHLLLGHVRDKSKKATVIMTEKAKNELSIGYFGSLIVSLTALKIADKESPRPISPTWLSPENNNINPNLVLESLLVNLANQSFSILHLANLGYAWPARILLRSTLELTWLSLVLVSDRKKMLLYSQNLPDKEERKLFNNYFSGSKLQEALTQIEQKLNIADDQRLLYSRFRSEAYTLFTKHVHNSFVATVLGTRAPTPDNSGVYEYALYIDLKKKN